MAYRGAVIEQQWTPEEMAEYCKKFDDKRPAYLKRAQQTSEPYRLKRTVNSNGSLSKAQYKRFKDKGVEDEHILSRYLDLTPERLEAAKRRWGFA